MSQVTGSLLSVTPRNTKDGRKFYISRILIGDQIAEVFSNEEPLHKVTDNVKINININYAEKKVSFGFAQK